MAHQEVLAGLGRLEELGLRREGKGRGTEGDPGACFHRRPDLAERVRPQQPGTEGEKHGTRPSSPQRPLIPPKRGRDRLPNP